jgi:hypothetical protein
MIKSRGPAERAGLRETGVGARGAAASATGNELGLLKSDSSSCVGCTRVAASSWGGFFCVAAQRAVEM